MQKRRNVHCFHPYDHLNPFLYFLTFQQQNLHLPTLDDFPLLFHLYYFVQILLSSSLFPCFGSPSSSSFASPSPRRRRRLLLLLLLLNFFSSSSSSSYSLFLSFLLFLYFIQLFTHKHHFITCASFKKTGRFKVWALTNVGIALETFWGSCKTRILWVERRVLKYTRQTALIGCIN